MTRRQLLDNIDSHELTEWMGLWMVRAMEQEQNAAKAGSRAAPTATMGQAL
jgi:hypothetical protein